MSFWNRIIGLVNDESERDSLSTKEVFRDTSKFAIVDVEVGVKDKKIHDIGALRWDGETFHSGDKREAWKFLEGVDYVCGHNIIHHDAKYLYGDEEHKHVFVDTLYISPLLFADRPYHRLVKDDKLLSEQLNNPLNDSEKARDLLMEEVSKWETLSSGRKRIYATLLHEIAEFGGFIEFVGAEIVNRSELEELIKVEYVGKICENTEMRSVIESEPVELAYALALIDTTDYRSVTPGWVLHNYPNVENVVWQLRHKKCVEGCEYCDREQDIYYNLKRFFGYEQFRSYEGDPLQENAVEAAVDGESLLAIFPTGGGKSLTFQLPALMEGRLAGTLIVGL